MDMQLQKDRVREMMAEISRVPFPKDLIMNMTVSGADLLPASAIASAQRFLEAETIEAFEQSYANFNQFKSTAEFLDYTMCGFQNAIGQFEGEGDIYLQRHLEILEILIAAVGTGST